MNLYNYSFLSRKQQAKKLSFCAGQVLSLMASGQADRRLESEYAKLLGYADSFKKKICASADGGAAGGGAAGGGAANGGSPGWPALPDWAAFASSPAKDKASLVAGLRYRVLDLAGIPQPESDFTTAFAADPSGLQRKDLAVLVDNVRSPFNVGSIIRTAEAFGFREAVLSGMAAASDEKKVLRAAMSADDHLEITRLPGIRETSAWISGKKEDGWTIVSLEKTGISEALAGGLPGRRAVIVVGNEEFGISDEILALSDKVLHIPLSGFKNSLNVAVAFGIAAAAATEQARHPGLGDRS